MTAASRSFGRHSRCSRHDHFAPHLRADAEAVRKNRQGAAAAYWASPRARAGIAHGRLLGCSPWQGGVAGCKAFLDSENVYGTRLLWASVRCETRAQLGSLPAMARRPV